MDNVQNISGTDTIPTGFSPSSEVQNEPVKTTEEMPKEKPPRPEENKGTYIDTYV